MDLDQRLHEILDKPPARRLAFEPGHEVVGHNVALEIRHDVEGDAEDALVLGDGDDRRKARESSLAQRELKPRFPHDVVGRGREWWTRGTSEHEPVGAALEEEREVRASPFTDPSRLDVAVAEVVLVEKRADAIEHEQRRLRQAPCS